MDKFDKKIHETWRRVQTSGKGPRTSWDDSLNMLAVERDLMQETLRQLRVRANQEKARWQKVLEQRDEVIAALKQNQERLESEIHRLRQETAERRSDDETRAELESLEKTRWQAELARQIDAFEKETEIRERHIMALEEARHQDALAFEKTQARWRDQEKKLLDILEKKDNDILSLKTKSDDQEILRQKQKGEMEDKLRAADAARQKDRETAEADRINFEKSAEMNRAEIENLRRFLEKAQAELARLAHDKQGLETDLRGALEQVNRQQSELHGLKEAWEAERGHWRELWDKERLSREKWYDQMREWEDHLRAERDEWLRQFGEEQSQRHTLTQKVENTVERLRQITWSVPVFYGLRDRGKSIDWTPVLKYAKKTGRWAVLAAGAAAAVALILVPVFQGPREYPAPTSNVAGLAARGDTLWFSDWMTGQVLQASAKQPTKILSSGAPAPDFHPVSLSLTPDRLWTLDTWSKSVQEHMALPPFAVLRFWRLPLATPVDLAWDGQGFWVLDRADQVLRRFSVNNFGQPDREQALPAGWNLVAVDYEGGDFWGYDEAAHRLKRFSFAPLLVVKAEYRLPAHEKPAAPLTGLRVTKRAVWTLSEKSLTLYRWSRLTLSIRRWLE